VLQFGHDRHADVYGKGAHWSQDEWGSLIRQLIHRGYLLQDIAHFNVLKLTPLTRPVLRDGEPVELARPRVRLRLERREKSTARAAERRAKYDAGSVDTSLFQTLRTLRKELATAQGVPPYVVFSDATLEEMAARRPKTPDEFLSVGGVGETKLARYGEEFLRVLTSA
jgi:ATP-dependent DNA helicase RecQ